MTATATYTGSLAPANLYANYTNKDNWQVTSNHPKPPTGQPGWTQTGDKSLKLLKWDDNVHNAKVVFED